MFDSQPVPSSRFPVPQTPSTLQAPSTTRHQAPSTLQAPSTEHEAPSRRTCLRIRKLQHRQRTLGTQRSAFSGQRLVERGSSVYDRGSWELGCSVPNQFLARISHKYVRRLGPFTENTVWSSRSARKTRRRPATGRGDGGPHATFGDGKPETRFSGLRKPVFDTNGPSRLPIHE